MDRRPSQSKQNYNNAGRFVPPNAQRPVSATPNIPNKPRTPLGFTHYGPVQENPHFTQYIPRAQAQQPRRQNMQRPNQAPQGMAYEQNVPHSANPNYIHAGQAPQAMPYGQYGAMPRGNQPQARANAGNTQAPPYTPNASTGRRSANPRPENNTQYVPHYFENKQAQTNQGPRRQAHVSYNTQTANRTAPQESVYAMQAKTRKRDRAASFANHALQKAKQFLKGYTTTQLIILAACFVVCVVSASQLINYVNNARKQSLALRKAENLYSMAETREEQPTLTPAVTPTPTYAPTATPNRFQRVVTKRNVVQAKAITPTPAPTATPTLRHFSKTYYGNELNRVREKFFELLNVNEDIVGWLKIGNILNQPVVKRDNEFYLTHNYLKEANPAGAIFADESTDLRLPPENLILHGHNMRNGSMFGKLIHYKSDKGTKFYIDNPIVQFDSLYQDAIYVIFAVYEIETDYTKPNYYPFIAYSSFATDGEAAEYIRNARARSLINVPIDVTSDDGLLTMATCTLNSDTTRLLVVGRKVRPGEDMQQIKDSIFRATRVR